MWIPVHGGPTSLWVDAGLCRSSGQEFAFYYTADDMPPTPDWLVSPSHSRLRESFFMIDPNPGGAPQHADNGAARHEFLCRPCP